MCDKALSICDPTKNLLDRDKLTRLADFLFEAGMLKKTPRTGFQFLGTGSENVAEHSFRTCIIGYVLAHMAKILPDKVVLLCLFHDFHEARTGDFNYVNKIYNSCQDESAIEHAIKGTGLEEQILPLWREQELSETQEAILAKDADQIDLVLNLVEQKNLGNPYAEKWLESAIARLRSVEAKKLAETILHTDHTDWWFKGPDASWWQQKKDNRS